MAASEIIWEKSCDGFLFHRYSRPKILEQLFRKIRENSQEKTVLVRFFKFQLPKHFIMDSVLKISDISEQLFQETSSAGFFLKVFFPRKQSPECDRKAALKNLRNFQKSCSEKFEKFLKKTSDGVHIFLFLGNKTTLHSQFPENFVRCFRTAVLKNESGSLLLRIFEKVVVP